MRGMPTAPSSRTGDAVDAAVPTGSSATASPPFRAAGVNTSYVPHPSTARLFDSLRERAHDPPSFEPALVCPGEEGSGAFGGGAFQGLYNRHAAAVGGKEGGSSGDDGEWLGSTASPKAAIPSARGNHRGWLRPLVCCGGTIHRSMRSLGFVREEDSPADLSKMLVCACTAVGGLLLLLFVAVAALVVVFVVVIPDVRHAKRQTVGPLLELNTVHNNGGAGAPYQPAPTFDARHFLRAGGLEDFIREAHHAVQKRRRLYRNSTLLAGQRRRGSHREGGSQGEGDYTAGVAGLAQPLLELEKVSYLLQQVSAHVLAVQQHDPIMGLTELSNFLLNVKGRPAALERAAARARSEALSEAVVRGLPSTPKKASAANRGDEGGGANGMPVYDDPATAWNAALKESFASRSEVARLRAHLRGFVGVSTSHPERISSQPFDDVAFLQYRHAWMKWEVLPWMRSRGLREDTPPANGDVGGEVQRNGAEVPVWKASDAARATPAISSAYAVANRMATKADLYDVTSIFNHIHYYPARRFHAAHPFSKKSVADADAWYSAIAAVVQTRFGMPLESNAASQMSPGQAATALPLILQSPPLSLLSIPRLGASRADELSHLSTAEDRKLMPEAFDMGAAVNTRSIFVNIASYRDSECAPTLMDLFRSARNPHRVYVGLVQQNRAGDSPCFLPEMYTPYLCPSGGPRQNVGGGAAATATATFTTAAAVAVTQQREGIMGLGDDQKAREAQARLRVVWGDGMDTSKITDVPDAHLFDESVCFFADQIRMREIDSRQAKGPTYGRYMAMLLYRGEDLTLVLDSHNRFRPMWDTLGVSLLQRFKDSHAVLSHYPESFEGERNTAARYRTTTAYLCKSHFLKQFSYLRLNGIVVRSATEFTQNNVYNDPYVQVRSSEIDAAENFRLPQPWVAGGFLFAPASIYRAVPFDPHLLYIFDGEEVLFSVRLWTHGYNIYSPVRNLCFHMYGRAKAPKVWSESALWYTIQNRVRPRLHFFLQSHAINTPKLLVPANSTNAYVVIDSSRYGMGRQRSVEEWYSYAGVDPVTHKVKGRWCGIDKNE